MTLTYTYKYKREIFVRVHVYAYACVYMCVGDITSSKNLITFLQLNGKILINP